MCVILPDQHSDGVWRITNKNGLNRLKGPSKKDRYIPVKRVFLDDFLRCVCQYRYPGADELAWNYHYFNPFLQTPGSQPFFSSTPPSLPPLKPYLPPSRPTLRTSQTPNANFSQPLTPHIIPDPPPLPSTVHPSVRNPPP